MGEGLSWSGAPRAKARGSSTCFVGPAFAEAASRRQAEPSEAHPTRLLWSFEGYPPRIHPRAKDPCLRAEVRYSTQAWLSA
jgi:hypothetical protein